MTDAADIKVLIIGAGIAGLTLAIALRRHDIQVDLVEIRSEITEQAGVGLSLQGNALAALGRISMADACIRRGVPAQHINLRAPDGKLIFRQPVIRMGGPEFPSTMGISRKVLHEILLGEAQRCGARIVLGRTVGGFELESTGVAVQFDEGSRQRYDLMVGADGVHSRTRARLFPDCQPAFCGQAVWRIAVPRPAGMETTELHIGGRHGAVGICPISPTESYLYIVEAADPATRYDSADLPAVATEKLDGYDGDFVRACVSQMPNSSAISYRHLEWLLLEPSWQRQRAVLIGDATHCNPPVLAQGAAMGIEDAVVLAEELASGDIDAALPRFVQRRIPRAGTVVKNSVQLCRWEVDHSVGPQEIGRLMLASQQFLAQPF